MSTLEKTLKNYICEICNTEYKSRQSLWNHKHKFHSTNTTPKSANIDVKNDISPPKSANIGVNINEYVCEFCNYEFTRKDSLKKHINRCKQKNNIIQKQNEEMQKQLNEMKSMIAELLKTRKIHPKTLQKINNNLINNNINNGTVNNTTIVKFGSVNINSVLTPKEVMGVLLKPFLSTEECINLIHFNDKRPQYNNIFITNLKDDLAYVYDGTKFTTVTKNDVIMELIDNYVEQVEISFEENRDKMPESKIKCVENYLNLINSEKQYTDQYNKVYQNFKAYKIGDVKRLIYDKSDPKKFAMICKNIQNTEIEV
jgi:hypothetical protein